MDGRRRAGNPIRPSGTVRSRLALAALASCLFIGCAWVETRQDDLDPSEPRGFDFHDKSRGIRYYEAAVFLLVHTDNKGSIVVKHMVLPDTTRKMSAEPHEILASTKATLTFSGRGGGGAGGGEGAAEGLGARHLPLPVEGGASGR